MFRRFEQLLNPFPSEEPVEPPKSYPGGATLLRYRFLEGPPETVGEAVDPGD